MQSGGREELELFGEHFGMPGHVRAHVRCPRVRRGRGVRGRRAAHQAGAAAHYTLRTFGFRVSNETTTLAYSGDCGPSERLAELARDVDLFLCEATLERGELDGQPRGHLSLEEACDAYEASGAKRLLLTHRPAELPVDPGSSRPTTASSSPSDGGHTPSTHAVRESS